MATEDKNIFTGPDYLLGLVNDRMEISTTSAAHLLNVEKEIIETWSAILEEEGLVLTRHTLRGMTLVSKEATTQLPEEVLETKSLLSGNGNGNGKILTLTEREMKLREKEQQVKGSMKFLQDKLNLVKRLHQEEENALTAIKQMKMRSKEFAAERERAKEALQTLYRETKAFDKRQRELDSRIKAVDARERELSEQQRQLEKKAAAASEHLAWREQTLAQERKAFAKERRAFAEEKKNATVKRPLVSISLPEIGRKQPLPKASFTIMDLSANLNVASKQPLPSPVDKSADGNREMYVGKVKLCE